MNPANRDLSSVLSRITNKLQQDQVVNDTLQKLREQLNVDRVVLYYFYTQWKGQVTFEAISDHRYSIIGSTGADDCFNLEYAALYLMILSRLLSVIVIEIFCGRCKCDRI
jgi:GAF domain-containing protein